MSTTIPASDLSPGDVLMLGDYPCDVLSIQHDPEVSMVTLRWSVCPKDVMHVSSNTPFDVLGRLDD